MIEPQGYWHPFQSDEEMLDYLKQHQLLSQTAAGAKPMYYRGEYSSQLLPCHVVGWQSPVFAVIRVNGALHTIHPDHLRELQPKKTELKSLASDDADLEEPAYLQVSLDSAFTQAPPAPKPRKAQSITDTDAYTVIDLETTGLSCTFDEIIEVAALRVRNGEIVDQFQSLVQCRSPLPPSITQITGIAPKDLADAPFPEEILPQYLSFLGEDPLLGHNVAFDVGFLTAACTSLGLGLFQPATLDTLALSRKKLTLPSYKLTDVRAALNLPEHNAHRALDDCLTTMEVFEALKTYKDKARTPQNRRFRGAPLERHPEMYPAEILSGPDSPFYGADCVLTGELHIDRSEAAALLEQAGAAIKSSVSRKTNFLIVGVQDKSLVGEAGVSTKEAKALALNHSGKASIQIISEAQLCALLSAQNPPLEPRPSSLPSVEEDTAETQLSFLNQACLEEQTFHLMEPTIRAVIERNFLDDGMLRFQQTAGYWSVGYSAARIARIHFGKAASYCALDAAAAREQLDQAGILYEIKGSDPALARIPLRQPEDVLPVLPVIAAVTQRGLDAIAKEFDCCSRVEACSNAKRCVNPSASLCVGCGYRKILASGRIFYGDHRN